jgi:HSP90 family molecular chaperone
MTNSEKLGRNVVPIKNDSQSPEYESALPNPSFLIKSIAEQGYSLKTAISDLIDNSIAANATNIEIIVDTEKQPFELYIADNGAGMSLNVLKKAMQFPSASPEETRDASDLGRFGLGMKTASFSQTRKFTIISKRKSDLNYEARTWDVNVLEKGEWKIIVENQ